jgi:glycosyltransferase involved in cell wall biosynthesis
MAAPSRRKRLAIVATHPIQYNSPLFCALAALAKLEIRVFYSWQGTIDTADPEFGTKIAWDIPLLKGYDYQFIPNRAASPGTHHFLGLDNPEMASEIAKWRPDAVLVYGWSSRTHLAVLRHFKGKIPVFFRGDSTLQSATGVLKPLFRKYWLRWIYQHVDCVLYVGRRNLEYFCAHGVAAKKLYWVPHSVDNERFAAGENADKQAEGKRRQLEISKDAIVFLFAGKLVPRKSPELLLGAFLELWREEPERDLHLAFAGTGSLEEKLRHMASDCPNVHFIGFQNQSAMPATYRLGDVFVLPSSRRETWGLAVNEAMASGRPIIVSDRVGCAPDLAHGREFAGVFPSEGREELKQSLRRFSHERSSLRRLGARASEEIQAWSTEAAAQRMTDAVLTHLWGQTS